MAAHTKRVCECNERARKRWQGECRFVEDGCVNDSLIIDFMQANRFDVHNYCNSVTDESSMSASRRLRNRKIPFRSGPHGPMDMQVNTDNGGTAKMWGCYRRRLCC